MPDRSNVPASLQQDCPFLKLSTELRLEICRFAIQHDLDVIKTTPEFYNSARPPLRGALALLHTCRALRVESIDAMEPLAQAWNFTLGMEWLDAPYGRRRRRRNTEQPETLFERLDSSMSQIEKVCELLALAHGVNEKTSVD